jgi:hypothetical protein
MANNIRNPVDVLRENIAQEITGTKSSAATNDASNAGQGAIGSFALTFRDPDTGEPKKWFKWGRHSFDDEDAIFY